MKVQTNKIFVLAVGIFFKACYFAHNVVSPIPELPRFLIKGIAKNKTEIVKKEEKELTLTEQVFRRNVTIPRCQIDGRLEFVKCVNFCSRAISIKIAINSGAASSCTAHFS